MNYYIYSDAGTVDGLPFPHLLSQFFEQYQGFSEESEVAQVSKILGIDLSPFQKYNEPETAPVVWLNVNELIKLTADFSKRIRGTPDLFSRMKYGGFPGTLLRIELMKAALVNDKTKMEQIVKSFQATPDSSYPPDTGYIKRGDLLEDVAELEKMLKRIKSEGGREIKLVYV
ncbi:MAG TPA: hypothetical protein VK826_08105 [Bacteroidia bacterium]|nr:hypothetical protein [Bacteroidia bacterium]